jgi:arginine decarboxylase-like protein
VFTAPGCPRSTCTLCRSSWRRGGIRTPYVIRFPTMIERQMETLKNAFHKAISDNHYQGGTSACTR